MARRQKGELGRSEKTHREREKLRHAITASALTTKWINAHMVSNVENVAATTTLRQNVKRKKKN